MSSFGTAVGDTDDFEFSTDPARLDVDRIEGFLRQSYWAPTRPGEVIEKSLRNSLCLGVYRKSDGLQVGFCRVVTDYTTFGWICDVFIDETCRARGLGTAMMQALVELPALAGANLLLATEDAHGLYEKFGFRLLPRPGNWMIRAGPPS